MLLLIMSASTHLIRITVYKIVKPLIWKYLTRETKTAKVLQTHTRSNRKSYLVRRPEGVVKHQMLRKRSKFANEQLQTAVVIY